MSPQPYVFPESASPQLKVVQDYIKYVAIFDFEKLSTLTTEDLVYKMRPASLGVPDRTRAELFAILAQLRDSLNGVPFTVSRFGLRCPHSHVHDRNPISARQDIVYDVNDEVGKTWVHVHFFHFSRIESPDADFLTLIQVKNEPLDLEIVFFFEFGVGPHALKIISFTEFLDTKRYLELNPES